MAKVMVEYTHSFQSYHMCFNFKFLCYLAVDLVVFLKLSLGYKEGPS